MNSDTPSIETFSLDERYRRTEGTIYLRGLHALIRLLLDQSRTDERNGLHTGGIVSGYPGSPVAGLDMELARQAAILREHHIVHVPGLNEDLAATAVFGSQLLKAVPKPRYDGVFGMWFGKAPGVDRSTDAFRHGNFRGIAATGGILAVAGDESDAHSSTLPSDSTAGFAQMLMPVLYPGDPQEVLDLGLHGYALSRASGLAVGFKLVTDVAECSGTAQVSPLRVVPAIPELEFQGRPFSPVVRPNDSGRMMVPVEREIWQARLAMARAYARRNGLNPVVGPQSSAQIGIVAAGRTYFDVLEGLQRLGLDPTTPGNFGARLMKLGMTFPLDEAELAGFAAGLAKVIVIETKAPVIETALRSALYGKAGNPEIVGKLDEQGRELVPYEGETSPESVARILADRLARLPGLDDLPQRAAALVPTARTQLKLIEKPSRTPYFCSGCPHSTSLAATDAEVVGAGIGCHILGLYMDRDEFGNMVGFTQMGAEGSQWVGLAPFTGVDHFTQNLGDGTYFHSGSLAIRFAVASKLNVTYKLLYNSAVAMTGGQDVTGARGIPELISLLLAEGVSRVVVTTDDIGRYRGSRLPAGVRVRPRSVLADVERELAKVPGVTVIIHDQQCAAEKRRLRKRGNLVTPAESVFINERVCEGCGDCGEKSNCLSVHPVDTEFGRKTAIHQSSCNFDYSCLKGDCPSFVKVKRAAPAAVKESRRFPLPDVTLPDPTPAVPRDTFTIFMAGIGGTGVVTVNQILCTAAVLDGRQVRALDDFGGSQKAGPVASHLLVSDDAPTTLRVGAGQADTLLCFDLLVATDEQNLARYAADRTVAVVSTSKVPTGSMVAKAGVEFPPVPDLTNAIAMRTRATGNVRLDSERIAEVLLSNHMASNMICVGAAYQRGMIPLPGKCILEAIRLNGASVDMNIDAFTWGRIATEMPELIDTALEEATTRPQPSMALSGKLSDLISWAPAPVRQLLEIRVPDLLEYQNLRYARRYADFVRQVFEAEASRTGSIVVTEAVARNLYKLMAYKDEYEVARLHLDAAARSAIQSQFGGRTRVYWQIHPPVLRALGLDHKVSLGPWFSPAFRTLRAMRKVRGTKLDPFGYTAVRRTERALVNQYRAVLRAALAVLDDSTVTDIAELAGLPDAVRGYEKIKERNVQQYQKSLQSLCGRLAISFTSLDGSG